MARIVYVGKNADGKSDNLYGSGVTWERPGDVQEVPDELVGKMLEHTDTWALADGEVTPKAAKAKKPSKADEEKDFEQLQEEQDAEIAGLQKMGKEALIAHAKRSYGIDLNPKKDIATLRTEARRLVERGGVPGKPAGKPSAKSAKKR